MARKSSVWQLWSLSCYCLLATLTSGQVVQLGGPGGPRPVTFGGSRSQYQTGPSYSQQLAFNGRPVLQQQQPQPQQHSSTPPGFGNSNGANGLIGRLPPPSSVFHGAPQVQQTQRPQPIVLSQRIPAISIATTSNHGLGSTRFPSSTPVAPSSTQAEYDEYEDYEEEDEIPSRQLVSTPPSRGRAPIRINRPNTQSAPQRLVIPQRAQQVRIPSTPISRRPTPAPVQREPVTIQRFEHPNPGQSHRPTPEERNKSTPPPVQTLNRYMRNNDDGSITWGYENEDGSFKEETIGKDCVVRGKYGYIDPEGNKREYEYQTGNPCDPNKRDQQEELDDEEEYYADGPSRQQELAGIISARPRPVQRRPVVQQQQQQLQPHQQLQQRPQQYAFPQQRQ